MPSATDDYIDNDQPAIKLDDLVHILRRRIWYFVIPAVLILAAAIYYAKTLPNEYRSSATILIEQSQIPEDIAGGSANFAEERLQTVSQRIMTTANLTRVIEKFNLYPERVDAISMVPFAERMRRSIKITMVSADIGGQGRRRAGASIAFSLGFEHGSPEMAKQVADELVSLFLDENRRGRQEAAREATEFLGTEANRMAQQIRALESQIAVFKEQHGNSLPEMKSVNEQMLQRVEQEIKRSELEERLLNERILYLETELARTPRWDLSDDSRVRVLTPRDKLVELESQLATESIRLREGHPDIINLQSEIDRMKVLLGEAPDVQTISNMLSAAAAELAALEQAHPPTHPDVRNKRRYVRSLEERLAFAKTAPTGNGDQPENPAYTDLAAKLSAARSEFEYLRDSRDELRQDALDFEKRLSQGPQVELEYRTLTRDYDNTVAKYQELKSKQLQAQLGESLETDSRGERFELIEPAVMPLAPFKPNRMRIVLVGFILGLGAGGGMVYLRQMLDNTVYGAQDVIAITGAPPMVMVPYFKGDVQVAADNRTKALAAYGLGALLLVGIGVFFFIIKPLGAG